MEKVVHIEVTTKGSMKYQVVVVLVEVVQVKVVEVLDKKTTVSLDVLHVGNQRQGP